MPPPHSAPDAVDDPETATGHSPMPSPVRVARGIPPGSSVASTPPTVSALRGSSFSPLDVPSSAHAFGKTTETVRPLACNPDCHDDQKGVAPLKMQALARQLQEANARADALASLLLALKPARNGTTKDNVKQPNTQIGMPRSDTNDTVVRQRLDFATALSADAPTNCQMEGDKGKSRQDHPQLVPKAQAQPQSHAQSQTEPLIHAPLDSRTKAPTTQTDQGHNRLPNTHRRDPLGMAKRGAGAIFLLGLMMFVLESAIQHRVRTPGWLQEHDLTVSELGASVRRLEATNLELKSTRERAVRERRWSLARASMAEAAVKAGDLPDMVTFMPLGNISRDVANDAGGVESGKNTNRSLTTAAWEQSVMRSSPYTALLRKPRWARGALCPWTADAPAEEAARQFRVHHAMVQRLQEAQNETQRVKDRMQVLQGLHTLAKRDMSNATTEASRQAFARQLAEALVVNVTAAAARERQQHLHNISSLHRELEANCSVRIARSIESINDQGRVKMDAALRKAALEAEQTNAAAEQRLKAEERRRQKAEAQALDSDASRVAFAERVLDAALQAAKKLSVAIPLAAGANTTAQQLVNRVMPALVAASANTSAQLAAVVNESRASAALLLQNLSCRTNQKLNSTAGPAQNLNLTLPEAVRAVVDTIREDRLAKAEACTNLCAIRAAVLPDDVHVQGGRCERNCFIAEEARSTTEAVRARELYHTNVSQSSAQALVKAQDEKNEVSRNLTLVLKQTVAKAADEVANLTAASNAREQQLLAAAKRERSVFAQQASNAERAARRAQNRLSSALRFERKVALAKLQRSCDEAASTAASLALQHARNASKAAAAERDAYYALVLRSRSFRARAAAVQESRTKEWARRAVAAAARRESEQTAAAKRRELVREGEHRAAVKKLVDTLGSTHAAKLALALEERSKELRAEQHYAVKQIARAAAANRDSTAEGEQRRREQMAMEREQAARTTARAVAVAGEAELQAQMWQLATLFAVGIIIWLNMALRDSRAEAARCAAEHQSQAAENAGVLRALQMLAAGNTAGLPALNGAATAPAQASSCGARVMPSPCPTVSATEQVETLVKTEHDTDRSPKDRRKPKSNKHVGK